jgi:hypothetical protein
MSIYTKKQIVDLKCEDGIWLDFQKNTWLFFIKDKVWQPEEIQGVQHNDVTVTFIQKGISDAFLLEVYDCIEVSDLPFCIKEADEDVLQSLHTGDGYQYEIVLLNETNEVCAVRDGAFTKEDSILLKKKLSDRMKEDFKVEDAEASYAKLSQKYEPYELEEFAVFAKRN